MHLSPAAIDAAVRVLDERKARPTSRIVKTAEHAAKKSNGENEFSGEPKFRQLEQIAEWLKSLQRLRAVA